MISVFTQLGSQGGVLESRVWFVKKSADEVEQSKKIDSQIVEAHQGIEFSVVSEAAFHGK